MASRYCYEISGTGANDRHWRALGSVLAADSADLTRVVRCAIDGAMGQISQPGAKLAGPYKITRLLIDVEPLS